MAHKYKVDPSSPRTATGTVTISQAEVDAYTMFTIDPGGSGRTVNLPAAAGNAGQFLCIANAADAAEVLTITADSATVCTPTQAETAFLMCDGTKWRGVAGANS